MQTIQRIFNKSLFRFEEKKLKLRMNKTLIFVAGFLMLLMSNSTVFAQGISPQDMEKMKKMEDSLVVAADSMFNAFIPDTRVVYSERFARQLVRALKIPNSYLYRFDTLQRMINIIASDDNAFRVFNWGIEPTALTKRYYGAIQLLQPQLKLIGLNDYSEQTEKGLEDSILSNRKWFGALYYRIMSQTVKGRKIYTMFGLNSGGMLSNKKVLDPMYFEGNGVIFGAPIFSVASTSNPQQPIKRFVMEYKKDVTASMNWDNERQMIVFDKLASVSNDASRKYTYVPSGQYDGFVWGNEMWNYKRNLVAITILKDGEAPSE
jgi:hypothetical protein